MGKLEELRSGFRNRSAKDILVETEKQFRNKSAFSTALNLEDQVITDLIVRNKLDIPIFTLDTGRLFDETYDLLSRTEEHYNIKIKVYFPEALDVEEYIEDHGINSFYNDIELRKKCCYLRKVKPLQKALNGKLCWICGLRKSQSVTRSNFDSIEYDEKFDVFKVSPLITWTKEQIDNYIVKYNVPVNKLNYEGYPSIGCSCCTRAISDNENIRAGRWWWESPEQKECGLHFVNGKAVRTNS